MSNSEEREKNLIEELILNLTICRLWTTLNWNTFESLESGISELFREALVTSRSLEVLKFLRYLNIVTQSLRRS